MPVARRAAQVAGAATLEPMSGAGRWRRALEMPVVVWSAFVLAHLWLGWLALTGPGQPLGDVTEVYRFWVDYGFDTGRWVGIDTVWVYPVLALAPMLAAWTFGPEQYAATWLSMVLLLDLAAFAVLLLRHPERRAAGWWWIGFLVALGPIAVGRIDAITVPLALMGVLALASRPRLAGALLATAAWIKVWPAVLGAAIVLAARTRKAVLAGVVAVSAAVAGTALILGGGPSLLSFVTQQTGRGLQIEAPISTFWMWDALRRQPGGSQVYYDTQILTFQIRGPGVEAAAALTTPLLVAAVAVVLVLLLFGLRRGVPAAELLPPALLALTVALILCNKVGSPQFISWLAVPILYGLVTRPARTRFRVPALMGLGLALLTQAIYPVHYGRLLVPELLPLLALTARNLLELALFAWTLAALLALVRRPTPSTPSTAAERLLHERTAS